MILLRDNYSGKKEETIVINKSCLPQLVLAEKNNQTSIPYECAHICCPSPVTLDLTSRNVVHANTQRLGHRTHCNVVFFAVFWEPSNPVLEVRNNILSHHS